MKNLKKAIAAGALGVAVIAGTAMSGTFATWQDAAQLDAGTITTGELSVNWVRFQAPRLIRDGKTIGYGTQGTALGGLTIIPGDQVRNNIQGNITLRGLTLNDVTITSELGELDFDENGFLMLDGETTALRFAIEPRNPNPNNLETSGGSNVGVLVVDFVRAAESSMYNNNLTENLGNLKLTVTQR